MRVRVQEIVDPSDRLVLVSAGAGRFTVKWIGELPSGGDFDVELTIQESLVWGQSIGRVGQVPDCANHQLRIRGIVQDLESDGTAALSVTDGIVLVETEGEPPLGVVGQTVELCVAIPEAHPYTL